MRLSDVTFSSPGFYRKVEFQGTGIKVSVDPRATIPPDIIASLPNEYRLAALTGYLVVLKKPLSPQEVPEFTKMKDALINQGYVYMDFPNLDRTRGFMIPH